MTVVVAMLITAMPNGFPVKLMFAFLNVDHHGPGSVLFKLCHRIYIFTTGYICIYMRRNLVPLGGRFNSNRNGRIVETSSLYCHLFYLLSFCRGREITFLR